jgi:CubicO group peptidase (beta-lactamase class C family)
MNRIEFIDAKGQRRSVGEWLDYSNTDAILVMHQGGIVHEEYFDGMTPATTHRIHSASKSLAATVVFNLIEDDKLDLNADVPKYVPELRGSGYEGATIQDCLDMQSGVAWRWIAAAGEKDSTFSRWTRALGVHRDFPVKGHHQGLYSALMTFPEFSKKHSRPHGVLFNYKESDPRVVAWAAEKVTKTRFADLLSQHVWSKLGAEHDAEILCDGLGCADTSDGVALTLRDFARFGQMLLKKGNYNGQQIVPKRFVDDITKNFDEDAITEDSFPSRQVLRKELQYRNQFWVYEYDDRVDFAAAGSSGQFCYVCPTHETVIVKFSTHPAPTEDEDMWFFTRSDENAIAAIIGLLSERAQESR